MKQYARHSLFCGLCLLLLAGCVSLPKKEIVRSFAPGRSDFTTIDDFCRKEKLQYRFNTLDDIIPLSSRTMEIKLLLASETVYVNGRMARLTRVPYYSKGNIYLPRELSQLLSKAMEKDIAPLMPVSIHTIVIDPGHGGKDPGALSAGGLKEKDLNLAIAKYLQKELSSRGFNVHLTRSRDIFLELKDRVDFARKTCADLFISIHANANRSANVKGFEVYYLSDQYNRSSPRRVAREENRVFDVDGLGVNSGEESLWDVLCVGNNTVSYDFANTITATFSQMGFYVRSPRGAPFYVLKYAVVPSVLVEVGYLSNLHEEKLLEKSYYQKQIAQGIALSVEQIDRKYTRLASRRR